MRRAAGKKRDAADKVIPRKKPARSAMIRARVDPALKAEAETIFGRVGLNASDAIRIFYRQVTLHRGLPFPVAIPNEETVAVLMAADAGEGLTRFDSAEDLFRDLDS